MVFVRQASPSRLWLVLAVVLLCPLFGGIGCRSKKSASTSARSTATPELGPLRPPPPPAETLPTPAEVASPVRRGGTLRVHLDAEPQSLLPLAEGDAAAAQITNGLVYETLLDCRDGTYRPGLAESWDVSNDGMRLAVRVRSGVRWHDKRAFGVLDVQGTVEPLLRAGTDAPVLRAELSDVASIELVTERTIRFVLKRPSDFALRALCDVPMLPDHLIHGVRPEASPIARQPVGTGPFRFAGWDHGKRIRLER
ncbi:MAG TPA: ABC transporter substrate-binding protein, partial [Polyangia bacterium]